MQMNFWSLVHPWRRLILKSKPPHWLRSAWNGMSWPFEFLNIFGFDKTTN
jgi:hypothetical protein